MRVTLADRRSRSPSKVSQLVDSDWRNDPATAYAVLAAGWQCVSVERHLRGAFALPFQATFPQGHAGTPRASYRYPWLLLMGKEKGFALTSIRAREMRRFLEREGYAVEPGQHKHLKLRHEQFGDVLLPLRPSDNLSDVALKQIATAMGVTPEELTRRVK